MAQREDQEYIYLKVPSRYKCIYTKLLVLMTDLGIDILKDCASTCKGKNKQIINCWNMFQAACSAYTSGQSKEATLLVNYINVQLNFGCKEFVPYAIPEIVGFKLNVTNVKGNQTININTITFNINNIENAKPNSLKLIDTLNNKIIANNLSINSPVVIDNIPVEVEVNNMYSWKLSIKDIEDYDCDSDEYSIICEKREIPAISEFSLNITDVIGVNTINITKAEFKIKNEYNVNPNSLNIQFITEGINIVENGSIVSPLNIEGVKLVTEIGKIYNWRATIEDLDGNVYYSNVYTIKCSEPLKINRVFRGLSTIPPQQFNTLDIESLIEKANYEEINGSKNNSFQFVQGAIIHYLCIPENVTLIRSQFGNSLTTVLWDDTLKDGVYKLTNKGGVYNNITYKVYFYYNPAGAFPDPITVVCKNK